MEDSEKNETKPNVTNSGSLNISLINLPNLEAIPLPQSMPFSNPTATSFAQIASSTTSATSLSANIYSHTLSEYGPCVTNDDSQRDNPILKPQQIAAPTVNSSPMGPLTINNESTFTGLSNNNSTNDSTNNSIPALTFASTNSMPVTTTNSSTKSTDLNTISINTTLPNNNNGARPHESEMLLYSPPPSNYNTEQGDTLKQPELNPNTARPANLDGRIPRKTNDISTFDIGTNLIEGQKLFRSYEEQLKNVEDQREKLELNINTMIRQFRGQNIELDPIYCRMRDDKRRCDSEYDRINSQLKRLETSIYINHNYRMSRRDTSRKSGPILQSGNFPKRAKMSTTPHKEIIKEQKLEKKDILLPLKDTNTWCNACDIHFNSLRELARHLHGGDHRSKMKKSIPWRSDSHVERWDKRKTYQTMKSICAKLTNDHDRNFSLSDVDQLLNPDIDPKLFKGRSLARERSNFDEDDSLFKVRGYDLIIPIDGYYCQLCQRALCDSHELENHIISYEHTYSHFKSMSLNEKHEKKWRTEFLRSYRKEFPPVSDETEYRGSSGSENKDSSSKSRDSSSIPIRYKKATSRIVDEHEVLKGRLPEASKKLPALESDDSTPRTITPDIIPVSSTEPKRNKRPYESEIPEIQPLNRGAPAALKRLKSKSNSDVRYSVKTANSRQVQETSSDSSDIEDIDEIVELVDFENYDEADLNATVLELGDVNSPFPQYRLRRCGNEHQDALTDKRLGQKCEVVLEKLNIEDYKHMLMDQSGFWGRVDALMAKKEKAPTPKKKQITTSDINTPANFFSLDGEHIAVDLNDNYNGNKNSTDISESKKDDEKKTVDTGKLINIFTDEENEENDQEAKPDIKKYMEMLDDFFVEK